MSPATPSLPGIHTQIKRLKQRRTKIVATVGPSTASAAMIEHMIRGGVNVFRLNFSHGSHAVHQQTHALIRSVADRCDATVGVLADLCGPKIRVGTFNDGKIELSQGETVTVTVRDVVGQPGLIPSQYPDLHNDVHPGDKIVLDDGHLELKVIDTKETEILCQVIFGGPLKNNKGMNLPGVSVSAASMTEKDRDDAAFALSLGVEFLALSFVRTADDIRQLREFVTPLDANVQIIAKIEKPEALANIDDILELSDGIMIARGDLGVELPPEEVPLAQERLIAVARLHRKPVIVATQMLESMMDRSRPTRAEVSDVANAVRAGTDAIMLSGETAAGKFPIEAVRMMDMVARQTEAQQWSQGAFGGLKQVVQMEPPIPVDDGVANAIGSLSRNLRPRAIVVISKAGRSVRVISASRPAAPLIGVTIGTRAGALSHLLWGVIPLPSNEADLDDEASFAIAATRQLELAQDDDIILLARGFSDSAEENKPSITVLSIR